MAIWESVIASELNGAQADFQLDIGRAETFAVSEPVQVEIAKAGLGKIEPQQDLSVQIMLRLGNDAGSIRRK